MSDFAELVDYLDNNDTWIRTRIYERITTQLDHGKDIFPAGATKVGHELIDALRYIFRTYSPTATLSPDATRRLRAWALDMRRIGFPAGTYETFAAIITDVLNLDVVAAKVINAAAEEMASAASAADLEGIAPATAARITAIVAEGPFKRVRLESSTPLRYQPGQFMPVMQPQRQGVWRALAPALPANPFGQLEFFVSDEIEPQVDQYLIVGAARGSSPKFSSGELVLFASGTGEAAATAIIFHALELRNPPRIELVLEHASRSLPIFEELTRFHQWLTLLVEQTPSVNGRDVVACGPQAWVNSIDNAGALSGARTVLRISPDAPTDWFGS